MITRNEKLVRDEIPAVMRREAEDHGESFDESTIRVAKPDEAAWLLVNKLIEESKEVHTVIGFDAPDHKIVEELADVLDVFQELVKSLGLRDETIAEAIRMKRIRKGGFDKRFVLAL